MFKQLQTNKINSNKELTDTYRGFKIAAEENNSAILGYTKNSFLRLYYTLDEETETIKTKP